MDEAGWIFCASEHLKPLSAAGDPLEGMGRVIDFEAFRLVLEEALRYGDGSKGGRSPYDPVSMFKCLVLAAQNNVGDARIEFLIRDRLSWLRFLGFDLGRPTPDGNTIRLFREWLTAASAIQSLFEAFDRQLRACGYLAMGGAGWRRHPDFRPAPAQPLRPHRPCSENQENSLITVLTLQGRVSEVVEI